MNRNRQYNIDNLTPFDEMDTERHREISSKGGKASGEARREKKRLREIATIISELCLKDINW